MSSYFLSYVCSKEEVVQDLNKTISTPPPPLPPKEEGSSFTIDGYTVDEGESTFEKGM